MNKVYIKAWFGDWREATPEEAYQFCLTMLNNMPNISSKKDRETKLNKEHLKNVTFNELKELIKNKK